MNAPSPARVFRIGCDIGGTFTDGVIMNEETGEIGVTKTPSTPVDPASGFMTCLAMLLAGSDADAAEVRRIFHGTTVATNAIIENQTQPTGLITNRGFTDVLEIGRQQRPKLYDLQQERPAPLVPGRWRLGVGGRIGADGEEIEPLDPQELIAAGRKLVDEGVRSVAICFLNSYRNPVHEVEAAAILRREFPALPVTTSAEISPLFREFGRFSTAVVNAAVMPIVDRYVGDIERQLADRGFVAPVHIIQSNGGLISAERSRRQPVHIIESGPAAGVIAAAYLGNLAGFGNILAFDMGGTTAKVGLVKNGRPEIMPDYEVGATARSGQYETGAGYAVTLPVIDLVEVGAGGGSIAWIDKTGVLKVGPRSAGADPGPACFMKGGVEPTVTDANVVLGRISTDRFLGERMALDAGLAGEAIRGRVSSRLDSPVEAAALGIVAVANSNMLRALRLVSTVRGYDPREFVLFAFGGAGPLHAGALADELGMETVVVPLGPGVTCALGALITDVRHDYMRTCLTWTAGADVTRLGDMLDELEARGRADLKADGFDEADTEIHRSADFRYRGQAYELTVPVRGGALSRAWIADVEQSFHDLHHFTYGHSGPGLATEIVSLRVTAIGRVPKPRIREFAVANRPVESAIRLRRAVWFGKDAPTTDCPIYDRYLLAPGHEITGPAVIEEMDSTVTVYPGWRAEVDRFGNLVMRRTG